MRRSPGLLLAAVCLAVFVINVSTTVVNVALPTIDLRLDTTASELVWVVDAFNLTFAAFVLAMGTLADRFGRRRLLLVGLGVLALASVGGGLSSSPTALIVWRAVAGVGAAIVFPATLAVLTDRFRERGERARAIGLWGASSGVAIAVGPVVGGWVLEHAAWGWSLGAVAIIATGSLLLCALVVDESRDEDPARLDRVGLVLSTVALAVLVHTIIEAPERGWASTATLAEGVAGLVALAAFVAYERRVAAPMLDVRLFTNLRFSAACGAVTAAFFALFGFIFLVTQYFQFVRGYSPLGTGVRLLPVATSVALMSIAGARLVGLVGNKLVVGTGLLSLTIAFAWTSTAGPDTSYAAIVGQMLFLGGGLGLTSTPATEAIMGVVPAARAGIGSAVNDATRELGGTLGVAIIGSVSLSVYRGGLPELPAAVDGPARASLGGALEAASRLPGAAGGEVRMAVVDAFGSGFTAGCLVAAGVCLVGALAVAAFLPAWPTVDPDDGGGA